jgi:ribokinase
MTRSPRILVVGAINLDLTVEVDRLPYEGETLVGRRLTQAAGGKGANQAVAAARLGAAVAFCGRVGDDDWGRLVAGRLAAEGVDAAGLTIDPTRSTGAAIILVEPTGKNQIIAVGGANLGVAPDDVDRAFATGAPLDALMLTLETPLETVQHAIGAAASAAIPVILDAAPPANYPLDSLRGVTVISPNETEAHALTGIAIATLDDAKRAAAMLCDGTGAKHVVMKLAERGCYLHEGGAGGVRRVIEPFKVKSIDATAAGDAFTAALAMRLCLGDPIDAALRYANAAGALTTTKLGAQAALPTAEEVERLLRTSPTNGEVGEAR